MSITISNTNATTESSIYSGKISVSCPQSAEQKDTEQMDEQIGNLLSKTEPTIVTIDETDEKEDFDYNPNEESQPESEEVSSDAESEQELEEEEEYDEEAIVNSLEFQKEFAAALENVKYIAKCDREAILEKIKEENIDEIGEEEADEQIAEAFETFIIEEAEISVSEESEYDSCDERVPEEEYNEAIEHIRELGAIHQEIFATEICETYSNLNEKEITAEELRNIFGRIRENFSAEAREEFMELNDNESDSDSDYDEYNESDLDQYERDNFIDKKQKIEIVYIDNNSDSEFFSSESESESDSESNVSDSEYVSDEYSSDSGEEESESESDDNYLPEKDAFDYSQDIEDEKIFTSELNGTDLNDITCDEEEEEEEQDAIDIE